MTTAQAHRGPDAKGFYVSPKGTAVLGHNRLSIIDLSEAGRQPMSDATGYRWIVFNGEIYNYLELRSELSHYPYRTRTDTEVILAAYDRWGSACLDHLLGMFAFAIWDEESQALFAARDRFGVKPLYYHVSANGHLVFSSESKALHAAGIERAPNEVTWSSYLRHGLYGDATSTFWKDIQTLPAGCRLWFRHGSASVEKWYDVTERVSGCTDDRPVDDVVEEYTELLKESVKLRFRSDVPVGVNLSGGLDSSTLLAVIHDVQGADSDVKAFTFTTGDPTYDEIPWVVRMLERTHHPLRECQLTPDLVPGLALAVQRAEDEPYGGIPTLAYARLFEVARSDGVIVLLDGQGMDEQWAGYDYYWQTHRSAPGTLVQGSLDSPLRPSCLKPEFGRLAVGLRESPTPGRLQALQIRDLTRTKLPRALRFNDRVSMHASTELREPFLDHRLVELALRQPDDRKLRDGINKWLLRRIAERLLPAGVVSAPKRPLQTPQREWLRGPLRDWASSMIECGLSSFGEEWMVSERVAAEWSLFCSGRGDTSFFVWQWITLGLMASSAKAESD